MSFSGVLNVLLAVGGLAAFLAVLLVRVNKETLSQQATLIGSLANESEYLRRICEDQQALIEQLHSRVKQLEAELAGYSRVV